MLRGGDLHGGPQSGKKLLRSSMADGIPGMEMGRKSLILHLKSNNRIKGRELWQLARKEAGSVQK